MPQNFDALYGPPPTHGADEIQAEAAAKYPGFGWLNAFKIAHREAQAGK